MIYSVSYLASIGNPFLTEGDLRKLDIMTGRLSREVNPPRCHCGEPAVVQLVRSPDEFDVENRPSDSEYWIVGFYCELHRPTLTELAQIPEVTGG